MNRRKAIKSILGIGGALVLPMSLSSAKNDEIWASGYIKNNGLVVAIGMKGNGHAEILKLTYEERPFFPKENVKTEGDNMGLLVFDSIYEQYLTDKKKNRLDIPDNWVNLLSEPNHKSMLRRYKKQMRRCAKRFIRHIESVKPNSVR